MPYHVLPLIIIVRIAESILANRRVYLILEDTGPRLLP